jgi:hypothetical protein
MTSIWKKGKEKKELEALAFKTINGLKGASKPAVWRIPYGEHVLDLNIILRRLNPD